MHDYKPVEWIRSGIPAVDLIIGAGIPRGRFVEVVGDPATAKSTFGYMAIGAFQRAGGQCILLDSEQKTDRGFAEKMGVDWNNLGYSIGQNIYQCIKIIGQVSRMADHKIPTLIVWDSIASTPGADELDEILKEEGMGSEKALRARELSKGFRATLGECAQKGVTLLGINQLRMKLNFRGMTTLDAPGGRAGKYHASVRLIMRNKGKIRDKVRDVIIGIAVECDNLKNTCAPPFRRATLRFHFDSGFVPFSGLDELLLRHGRLIQKAGWLEYRGKAFRAADLERIITEIPDILDPIRGTIEQHEETPGMPPPDMGGNGGLPGGPPGVAIAEEVEAADSE